MRTKLLLLGVGAILSMASIASAVESTREADRTAIDAACTSEATTAGCGSEKVGSGLLKCIHAYKKANKGFKPSAGCKSAIEKLREDRKSGK